MIAVTTPTGNIGSGVVRQLMDAQRVPVRVIVRNREKLPNDTRNQVEIVEGDLRDPATLERGFDGAAALFWCQPDCPAAADYLAAYESLAATARDAIRGAKVRRVVAISAAGSTPDRPAGPITALHRMEAILAEAGTSFRFLRCGSFFENLRWQWEPILNEGRFIYPMAGDVRGPQVATQDIARVAVKFLTSADWEGTGQVQLLGPQDLSYEEMAQVLSQQLGRSVRYEAMDPIAYRELLVSFGHSPDAAQALVDMFTFLADGYCSDAQADRSLTPTTLTEWLRRADSSGT